MASQLDANFLKVVSSAIVDKYIGESARLIREMFGEWIRSEFHIDTLSCNCLTLTYESRHVVLITIALVCFVICVPVS